MNREERILVLAPTGRDAQVTCEVLARAGVAAQACADLAGVCAELQLGAGAVFLAEEALTPSGVAQLAEVLRVQPPWSDLPIIVSTGAGETTTARVRAVSLLDPTGNVTVLERPVRVFTLTTTAQAALRARRRQYQMRDLHLQLQRQNERLEQERELRARFVNMLAHDLRGPVSSAMLAAETLIRRPERLEERRELGARVKRNMERIEQMVRDLLDANRVQAGEALPLRLAACDLTALVRELVDELNILHVDRLRLVSDEWITGVWSAAELRRALWNLATNAIKYGAPGCQVTISLRRLDGRVRLSVHNQGRPLSLSDQQRLFEPFSRVSTAHGSGQLGWGLGLTLVRGCAEAHGGRVSVMSSEEEGTTFTLELPLDATPFVSPAQEERVSAPALPAQNSQTL